MFQTGIKRNCVMDTGFHKGNNTVSKHRMGRRNHGILPLFVSLCILMTNGLVATSCGGGDDGEEGNYLTLDVSNVFFDADGMTFDGLLSWDVYVNTNMSFRKLSIHSSDSWCRLKPNSSDNLISISADRNTSGSLRNATITISGGGLEERINVFQQSTSGDSGDDGDEESELPAPKNVMASSSGTYVMVSWNSVYNASSYIVYRSASASGSYSYIGESYSTSFSDRSPLKGSNYYKVKAQNTYYESRFSDIAFCTSSGGTGGSTQKPAIPIGVTCKNEGPVLYPSILISWNAVEDATSYQVYRSSSANGGYTKLGNSTNYTYVTDNSPKSGDNYYKVKAINSAGESDYSSYVFYKHDPQSVLEPPSPNVTISGTSPVRLTWTVGTSSTMGIAKEFKVWKRNPNTGIYDLVTTTTNKNYTDYSPHPGPNQYCVAAVSASGKESGKVYAFTKDWVPIAAPTNFSATKLWGSEVHFSWKKVAQATGYKICWHLPNADKAYVLEEIDVDVDNCNCAVSFSAGTTIYFRIKAVYSAEHLYSAVESELSNYSIVKF